MSDLRQHVWRCELCRRYILGPHKCVAAQTEGFYGLGIMGPEDRSDSASTDLTSKRCCLTNG
jgi:hypothetical protein